MDYSSALGVAFRSPRWGINLLCCSACLLLPVIGPLLPGVTGDVTAQV